ncbi:malignant fibrous histiocytoma-amplified sequence 1 homolog [Branchiostoma floridae]|uniref:Malignant fibrous histiocytoma-amplified sequence 1 homolog n=1 Tax=Branchiostoma floridae TaxID=7739 RepID=A0A9J7HQ36_BRAFL|nr:malignant fibrous histiocytoma-amplified sequence 1 homolog [Branchiostoma floridae]
MATQMRISEWTGRHLQIKEKLFQNGQASWPDADYYMQMSNWTQLEKLEFPDCSFEWKSLTDGTYSLAIKSKDPPCIPDFLKNDPRTLKVSQLHLSVNRMKKIPAGISIFSQVTDVKLDRNKLKSLTQEFTELKKIKNLDLGNNVFKTFPAQIKEFRELEVLRFSVNQVEEIPPGVFPCLPKMKNLRIGSNRLKTLPEDLVSLERLEYLKISSNKFTMFPPQLLQLPRIRQVCLSANKITEVPLEFFDKPLELFQAEDNPLSEPPQEVCIQGIIAIKQYCQSLKAGVTEDRRMKLMLLGDTGAGKTSLCLSLKTGQSNLVDIQDRTHGIDRHDITEGDVTFLTWDFAGQQDYLVTHPVFITKDALVLLVVNLETYRLGDEKSYRRHVGVWIDNIAMRVPNAAVLVVGTHLDRVTAEDAQEKLADILKKIEKEQDKRLKTIERHISQLKRKLDQPGSRTDADVVMDLLANLEEKQGVRLRVHPQGLPLSSAPGLQGFDSFKQTVSHLAQTYLQQAWRKIPTSWTKVENLMKPSQKGRSAEPDTGPGVIDIDEAVDDILHFTDVKTRHEAKVVLKYLHGLGLLIWYSEIDCLKTYVFVDPAVLVAVFKVVIRDGLQEELASITMDQMADEGMMSTKFKVGLDNLENIQFMHKSLCVKYDRLIMKMRLNSVFKCRLQNQLKKFQRKALLDHRILTILWKKAKDNKMLNVPEDVQLLVNVLEQFQLCFTYTPPEPDMLNPAAPAFHPGSPWAPPSNKPPVSPDQLRKSTMYLFPCYLHDTLPSDEWSDPCPTDQEQIRVGLTFFPEVPYGFFERLCVCLHQLCPGLKLWRDSAKLCQNNVSMVVRKHQGCHGDSTVSELQDVWNDPTIEMVARGNKPDPADPTPRDPLWDPVLRVLVVDFAQSLLTLWPGVNIDMFSLCPRCEPDNAEVFEVPLPVKLESDEGQATYCETCEDSVPRALVYPVGTANPAAETLSQYPLVNNKSYFYTYNIHNSSLSNCQVGNKNNQVQTGPTQGGLAGQATGGTTPPAASSYRGGATTPPTPSYRGGATTPPGSSHRGGPPGYANRGDTCPLSSAHRGGATTSPEASYRGGTNMAPQPLYADENIPQLQPPYQPPVYRDSMLYSQPMPAYNQPTSYNQPLSLAPHSRLSNLARNMGSLRLQLEQGKYRGYLRMQVAYA